MRYISTRGGVEPVGFADAVMMGLATDGGLLLPESIPQVDEATLKRWAGLSFQELACEVMGPYVEGGISEQYRTPIYCIPSLKPSPPQSLSTPPSP